MMTLEI